MEYNLNKGEISLNKLVLDTATEQPIDINFTLPDYCPDINKILKCQVKPMIQNRSINSNKLGIEGNIKVRLLYLDEEKQVIRNFSHSVPFNCSLDIKHQGNELINPIIFTKEKIEYINCRAISPRRMNISGAFSIKARVLVKSSQKIVNTIEDENVQQKLEKVSASIVSGETEKSFIISEILELAQNKTPIENIIRSDVIPILDEVKLIDGKIIIKGEICIKVMYQSDVENNNIQTMQYSVPMSQILSVDGVNEECLCEAKVNLLSYNMDIATNSDGENSLIECEMHFIAAVIAYEKKSFTLISDAYSTRHDMQLEYGNVYLENVLENSFESATFKEIIEPSNNTITEIIDVWNDILYPMSNSAKSIKGKYNICILAKGEDGVPIYIEKLSEFDYTFGSSEIGENVTVDPDMNISNLTYRISGNGSIEVKVEMRFNFSIKVNRSYKSIVYATADENKEKEIDKDSSLIIYYAKEGESVWDIAMRYGSSPEKIKQENDICTENLSSDKMLLIPV